MSQGPMQSTLVDVVLEMSAPLPRIATSAVMLIFVGSSWWRSKQVLKRFDTRPRNQF